MIYLVTYDLKDHGLDERFTNADVQANLKKNFPRWIRVQKSVLLIDTDKKIDEVVPTLVSGLGKRPLDRWFVVDISKAPMIWENEYPELAKWIGDRFAF